MQTLCWINGLFVSFAILGWLCPFGYAKSTKVPNNNAVDARCEAIPRIYEIKLNDALKALGMGMAFGPGRISKICVRVQLSLIWQEVKRANPVLLIESMPTILARRDELNRLTLRLTIGDGVNSMPSSSPHRHLHRKVRKFPHSCVEIHPVRWRLRLSHGVKRIAVNRFLPNPLTALNIFC